jgi:hypothetical protein
MISRKHPMKNQTFTAAGDGLVLVEDHDSGVSGSFGPDGSWVSGDLRFADVNMVRFVAHISTSPRLRRGDQTSR